MQELLNRVRSRSQDWPLLDGTVHIARLALGQLEVANASADLTLRDGSLEVRSLDGRTLGGAFHATGAVDLASTPSYDAAVQLRRVSASELAQLLKEHWGPGTIDLSSDLAMSGTTASALSGSAKGTLHWSWTGGALPQLTSTPLRRFDRWTGNGKVAKGAITITSSEVTSNSTTAMVTGTIGSDRSLDLKVAAPPKDSTQTPTQTATTAASSTTASYNDERHARRARRRNAVSRIVPRSATSALVISAGALRMQPHLTGPRCTQCPSGARWPRSPAWCRRSPVPAADAHAPGSGASRVLPPRCASRPSPSHPLK